MEYISKVFENEIEIKNINGNTRVDKLSLQLKDDIIGFVNDGINLKAVGSLDSICSEKLKPDRLKHFINATKNLSGFRYGCALERIVVYLLSIRLYDMLCIDFVNGESSTWSKVGVDEWQYREKSGKEWVLRKTLSNRDCAECLLKYYRNRCSGTVDYTMWVKTDKKSKGTDIIGKIFG